MVCQGAREADRKDATKKSDSLEEYKIPLLYATTYLFIAEAIVQENYNTPLEHTRGNPPSQL